MGEWTFSLLVTHCLISFCEEQGEQGSNGAVYVSLNWSLALGKLQMKGHNKNIKFTKIKSFQC